jgi:hypothetical protein
MGLRTGNGLPVAILSEYVDNDGSHNGNKPKGYNPGDKQQRISEHDSSPPFRQQKHQPPLRS